jgi:hypothetical protein
MSFKITKKRKIQAWLEETVKLINITSMGKEIPIDLTKLPPQLKERITVHIRIKDNKNQYRSALLDMLRGVGYEEFYKLVTVKSLEKDHDYIYSWSENAPFPLIFRKYLEFVLKSLPTLIEEAEDKPINIEERISGGWKTGGTWAGTGWAFKEYIYEIEYKDQLPYSKEEEELLILEQYDLERQKFERLKRKYKSATIEEEAYRRERISEEVRIAVWRRDDGKCACCGHRENLEYDHIVPVSKGGGNTARNIELLCESCNRKKSNKIE